MGIHGLLKYIQSGNSTIRLDSVVLFKRGNERIVVVCDLIGVFFWLIESLHKAKVACKDYSPYSAIYGGNFKDYKERILGFVEALRFINIEPVFFWDGPQGSSYDYEHKLATWKGKSKSLLRKIRNHAEICDFHAVEIKFEKRLRQTLLFEELVFALRGIGVTVTICEGEADDIMAQYAREHKEVYTILTNDTDLALMSGVSMVHYKLFDRKDALGLRKHSLKCHGSHEICCDLIKSEYLARDLRIDEKCLPALSILCGNDFTKQLNKIVDINNVLGFSHPFVVSVSNWIKYHENDCKTADLFLSIKEIGEVCEKYPEYEKAIMHSYKFYQPPRSGPAPVEFWPSSPLHDFIVEKVKKYQMDQQFLSLVKNGIMWRYEIEQLDKRFHCIHETLQGVRILLYKLLCIHRVTEYGQHNMDRFVEVNIWVNKCEPETLSTLLIQPFSVITQLQLMFNALKACMERDIDYIKEMDDEDVTEEIFLLEGITKQKLPIAPIDELKDNEKTKEYIGAALTCACISFVIKNKLIPGKYTDPVIIACFCCAIDEVPPKLAGRPGPTGVTIAAQFMVILKHARLLASLLGLEELLPLPSTIFQPFIYIPLHGTAFKIFRKERFYNEDTQIFEYYKDISLNKSFIKYKNLITSADCCYASVIDQYLKTKTVLLDRKSLDTHKSIKTKKK